MIPWSDIEAVKLTGGWALVQAVVVTLRPSASAGRRRKIRLALPFRVTDPDDDRAVRDLLARRIGA